MITITITGPAKSGKSYIAQRIKWFLESMEISAVIKDPSPSLMRVGSKPIYVLGGEVAIIVKSKAE